MPYITKSQRKALDETPLDRLVIHGAGELNYAITCICRNYIDNYALSYNNVNDVIGALECAKQEFYRRVAASYEDEKIKQNGDVF